MSGIERAANKRLELTPPNAGEVSYCRFGVESPASGYHRGAAVASVREPEISSALALRKLLES